MTAASAVLFSVSACGSYEQQKADRYKDYRSAVKNLMRDPDSAQFKNESLRTLWSKEGSRLKYYCAEVNGNNAFGEKSGYRPATVIVDVKSTTQPEKVKFYEVGSAWIYAVEASASANFYAACQRTDTQRSDKDFFASYSGLDKPSDVDASLPVLSMNVAPEER